MNGGVIVPFMQPSSPPGKCIGTTVGLEALHDDCEGKVVGNSQRAPVDIPPGMCRIRMTAVCIKNIGAGYYIVYPISVHFVMMSTSFPNITISPVSTVFFVF